MIQIHMSEKEFDLALLAIDEVNAYLLEVGDKQGHATVLHTLASIRLQKETPIEAMKVAEQALDLYKDMGDKKGIAAVHHLICDIHCSKEKADEALESMNEVS